MAGRIRAGIRTARNRAAAAIRLYGKRRTGRLRKVSADESDRAQGFFHAATAYESAPHSPQARHMAKFNWLQNQSAIRRATSARKSAERIKRLSAALSGKVRGKKRK